MTPNTKQTSTSEQTEQTLQMLSGKFRGYGKKPALVSFTADGQHQLSFRELSQSIEGLSTGLLNTGLHQHEAVILLADNSPELVVAALSVINAGGVCVPVDMQSSNEVLRHIIKDCGAHQMFVDAKGFDRYKHMRGSKDLHLIRLDEEPGNWRELLAKGRKAKQEFPPLAPDHPAVIFYTSGTTGLPKGVPLTHANIFSQLEATEKTKLVEPSDCMLLPLPLFHVYPFAIGLSGLFMGLTLLFPKSVTGPEIVRSAKEGNATVLVAVPRLLRALYTAIEAKAKTNNIDSTAFDSASRISSFARQWLGLNLGKFLFGRLHTQFPKLRLLACGGALLEPELARKLMALGWDIAVGYGLTETSPLLSIRMPGNRDLEGVGSPLPGVQIRLKKPEESTETDSKLPHRKTSENNKEEELAKDNDKEIQAKGPNVFKGYLNLPEKTAECFTQDGWFKTGDLGMIKRGNLHVTGRISTMLKSEGGKKIQPEELEKAYEGDPSVREIGMLQVEGKLVAVVVPNLKEIGKGDARDKLATVIRKKSEALPSYYRITDFVVSKEVLPRTNLGKIRRQELAERYEKTKSGGSSRKGSKQGAKAELSAEDKVLLENPIAKACWEWLNERFPDADLDFDKSPQIDLNVDSLEWLNLTLEMHERFGVTLTEEAIARVDTVRDLLNEVSEAAKSGTDDASPFEHPERFLDDRQKNWLKPLNPMMFALAYCIYWLNYIIMHICFRVTSEGLERLPKGQVVFTPNHESYLDAFAIMSVLPFDRLQKTQWAGWAGIALANPFNAFMYRLAQAIPIESQRSLISSLALTAAVLRKKKSLVWFPEGERTLTGRLLPFKSGIGMVLQKFSVKVIPVVLVGTREALPPGAFFPRFAKIKVVFGEPMQPEQLAQEGEGDAEPQRIANALHDRAVKLKRGAKRNS